jgi:hypothetical protein
MKYVIARLAVLLLVPWTTLRAVEPPQASPPRLPTSPAEVAEVLECTDAAEARLKQLGVQRTAAKNALAQTVNGLRYGAFKAAGGFNDPDYTRLTALVADLDDQMKVKRAAMTVAEKAGDKDERAALELEGGRLRTRKDAAQMALDAFIVKRCRVPPAGQAAAEKVQALENDLAGLEKSLTDYGMVVESWRGVADGYRQRQVPDGFALTKVRQLELPPPADAAKRKAEFARRNDAAATEALAHQLFRALDEKAKGLEQPFALYREKKFAAALEAYRAYFFDKLTHLEKYGVPSDALIHDQRPPLGTPVLKPEWVADAMRGIATQPNRAVSNTELLKFSIGEPGAVNWAYVPFTPQTAQKLPVWLQVMRQFHVLERESGDSTDGVRCWLMDAYQVTGEAKYLQRWAEYADDWALNMQRDLNALPVGNLAPAGYDPVAIRMDARQAPYCWNVRWYPTLVARQPALFVTRLRVLVLAHPEVAREFPAATLARVLLVALDEYLAPNILVARATRFNWNMMGLGFNVRNGLLLGEFKAAQWAGREAARAFQNHATFSIMPDGGYVEYTDEGHQGVWVERASQALQIWQAQAPAWFDAPFAGEFKEHLTRNGEFFLRHMKSDGYRHRDDYRSARFWFVGTNLWSFGPRSLGAAVPWVAAEPEAQRMVGTVFGTEGACGAPQHVSDVMPCLGEFMLRGGWGPDDPFFYMHSGRIPNSNPDEDCNGFKLHNYGRHLLTAQPVYVDGRTQNAHFKLVDNVGAKTAFLTHSDGQPVEGRWHTSDRFDFAEGVYAGAYEDRNGRPYSSTFHTGGYDLHRQFRSLGLPAVTDVQRHTRQVFFVRQPVAWIVVDRVSTAARHAYEVPFEFYTPVDKLDWLRRAKTPIPKADQRVVLDEAAHVMRTDNPGFPKLALHHFSSSLLRFEFDPKSHDLAHKDNGEFRDAEREWKSNRPELRDTLAFVRRTLVKWSGEGDQVLVTFITTAPADADVRDAWQVQGDGTAFAALAPDGTTLHFAASTHPAALKAGDVAAEADTLLVVQPKVGPAHGIMLGARSAEFTFNGKLAITREIYAPIKPVNFAPEVNVFCDHTDVTMACATPDVEIRYTLDGSEPTLEAPRYDKPVRLTKSAVVRAIAVRAGAKELHWPLDPGFATLPTRAVFTQQALAPAVQLAASRPGLAWQYAEGQPFALVANSDTVPAAKSGVTERLLDVTMHTKGRAFVARYDGFLAVPADGVYTFHAPREFVIPDVDPGYDLRVFVDGQEWWPTMRWHALGTWSRALARGPHQFQVIFTDTRTSPYKHETWQNWPNLAVLWQGVAPVLEVSGPGFPQQPVPATWLRRP